MTTILALDLSSRVCGWAAGTGERLPAAGAFVLDQVTDDYGALGSQLVDNVEGLIRRFEATYCIAEHPLLIGHDNINRLIKLYGVFMLALTIARRMGLKTDSCTPQEVKAEFAGRGAEKADMVAMCERLGIRLPATKAAGREDAADGVGVFKVGLRLTKSPYLPRWDTAIYSHRGALL